MSANLEGLAQKSEIRHVNPTGATIPPDLIVDLGNLMTSTALLKKDCHEGRVIDVQSFPDFNSLKKVEVLIRDLALVPKRAEKVQEEYEKVPTTDFIRLVEDYYFGNMNIALVRETHPTELPSDVDQHVIWFKDGVTKEEVAEFIGGFLVERGLGINDVILFERSRKSKTPLVGAAIHQYRHIHMWTRKL